MAIGFDDVSTSTEVLFSGRELLRPHRASIQEQKNTMSNRRAVNASAGFFAIFLAIMLVIGILSSIVTVDAGYRGVKMRFGKVTGAALEPGLHFKVPLIEDVEEIEVREKKHRLETSASSADLQTVQSHIVVNFHPMPSEVSELYEEIGLEYELRVLDPAVEETVKAVTAQYTAEELITKREEVRDLMETKLGERVVANHIQITKFNIVNFEFSTSFNAAIEAKQTAEQEALQAENDLRRIKVEADQEIATAGGRAESVKLEAAAKAEAIRITAEAEAHAQEMLAKVINRDVVALRAIEKWDGIMPKFTGDQLPFVTVDAESSGMSTAPSTTPATITTVSK